MLPGADLFKSDADVLVNATNASGVMGGGIAALFRRRFPSYYDSYMRAHWRHELSLGIIHAHKMAVPMPRAIVSLHTMKGPGEPGNLGAINTGLYALGQWMAANYMRSAAIPALGCGIGGLDFKNEVLPAIRKVHDMFPENTFTWDVYPPR